MAIDSHHAPARGRRLSRPDDALLTEVEAADLLRMSERTLQAWRGQGRGPAFVRAGRAIRYRRSDLAIWIEAHVVPLDKVSPPPPSHAASSQQSPPGTP